MRLNRLTAESSHSVSQFIFFNSLSSRNPFSFPRNPISPSAPVFLCKSKPSRFVQICSSSPGKNTVSNPVSGRGVDSAGKSKDDVVNEADIQGNWKVEMGNPVVPSYVLPQAKMILSDQAFFLLACTTSVAFTSLVIAAVQTLYAMGKAAISLSKLADTACEELPSTMAAIRLSGMEVSDLTLELSDLSQEIADGIDKSAQVVQSAEAGIRQIGTLSLQETLSMIQERASLPIISLQPVVAGAARMTSRAIGDARKTFMNIISRGEFSSENEDNSIDRLDI